MASITNNSAGMRGINLRSGGTLWVDVGQTVEYDEKDVVGALPDMSGPAGGASDDLQARLDTANKRIEELEALLASRDHPALTGKNKAELLDIAKAEGVSVADNATNDEIKAAIEAKRNIG